MKKLVGILVALVIVLGGLLIFEYLNDNKEEDRKAVTEVVENSTGSNETYQFQDIESLEKAKTIEEAFERIFGKGRLFNNSKILYDLGFYSGKIHTLNSFSINIEMKPGLDTRMEMIDFLHYLQYSRLTTKESLGELPPENHNGELPPYINNLSESTYVTELPSIEGSEYFYIDMKVFQPIKTGMNLPESHQSWVIKTDKIEVMDFSDKETML